MRTSEHTVWNATSEPETPNGLHTQASTLFMKAVEKMQCETMDDAVPQCRIA